MTATAALSCVTYPTDDGTPLCSWNDNPSTRGTLDILWLCASTLAICVWNAFHPDVPYPGTSQTRIFRKRVWWLLIALVVPEVLVFKAMIQFNQARLLLVRVSQETRVPTKIPWWMRVKPVEFLRRKLPSCLMKKRLRRTSLTENDSLPRDEVPPSPLSAGATSTSLELEDATTSLHSHSSDARKHPWTLTHSFCAVMHGFVTDDGDPFWTTKVFESGRTEPFFDVQHGIGHITAPLDHPRSIPDIAADDLNDRSKAGVVAKLFLAWQLIAFIANCVVRWKQSLPLSLLEITTLAHCLCSLITLVLWWYKPHSVGVVIGLDRTSSLPPKPRYRPGMLEYESVQDIQYSQFMEVIDSHGTSFMVTVLAITLLYGLPHLAGCFTDFPSPQERMFWVIATSGVIGYPVTSCFLVGLCIIFGASKDVAAFFMFFPFLPFSCIMLSIFLVGESVRQAFALPEGCFHQPQLAGGWHLPGIP